MQPMSQILIDRVEKIRSDGLLFLETFCGMKPANSPTDSLILISASGDHFWTPLSAEGKQCQRSLANSIAQFSNIASAICFDFPTGDKQLMNRYLEELREAIDQNGTTWWKSKDEAISGFNTIASNIVSLFQTYFSPSSPNTLAICDTNALLANPDLENWTFDDIDHITIILTPAVLSELDSHKINHRNEAVRTKSNTLINKIKEYGRRGSLLNGVTVVKNRVSCRSFATEPNMAKSLPWLDAGNPDDRFLASTLEIIRQHCNSQIFIVTRDINMQNKAALACIPYVEPPC